MSLKGHFELLSNYNQWMNSKVYEAAAHLTAIDLAKDRGAFFSSILGTLNHIVVGDTIWLKRFATQPSCLSWLREVADLRDPTSLAEWVFEALGALAEQPTRLDREI